MKIAELVTEQLNMIFQDSVVKVSWSPVMLVSSIAFFWFIVCPSNDRAGGGSDSACYLILHI